MHRVIGVTALAGFLAAVAVHLAAIAGVDVAARFPYVWVLRVLLLIVVLPFIMDSRKTLAARPWLAGMRAAYPSWVVVAGVCLFAYTLLNFFVGIYDVNADSAARMRVVSGPWLVGFFFPFAHFMLRKRGAVSAVSAV